MSYVCPKLPSTGILSQHQLRITEGMEGTGLEGGGGRGEPPGNRPAVGWGGGWAGSWGWVEGDVGL